MPDQAEIYRGCISQNIEDRRKAAKLLKTHFPNPPDKDIGQAWQELHRLTQDQDVGVRWEATGALETAFRYVPDKDRDQAWQDIHRLTQDQDVDVRWRAIGALETAFRYVPDKDRDQAWQDIHRLTQDQDVDVRWRAADALGNAFRYVPDKDIGQAWQDLIRLTQDKNSGVRWRAAGALETAFRYVPDKDRDQAWQDLHRLTQDQDVGVRWGATGALETAFSHVPDKDRDQAWQDLIRLTQDKNSGVRWRAAGALETAFRYVPDKDRGQAWQDLIRLTQDKNSGVRWRAAGALETAFRYVPDKDRDQAWQDIHRLTQDQDVDVRWRAADALETAFSHVPDKDRDQAWQDLHRLTQDQDVDVRWRAIGALETAFSHVPDKDRDQAWQDLIRLTQDQNSDVRWRATGALGNAFRYVSDKDIGQAWQDLIRLTQDQNSDVRCHAYYALGRVSIYEATQTIEASEFKGKLEKAIEFFDKSSKEVIFLNPASFCLPFYRSLRGLLFMDKSGEEEIQSHLDEARKAVQESESKEALLGAIENFSKALHEARTYTVEMIIQRSKAYSRYCTQTADCLKTARSKAPYASMMMDAILVEKGIPIIDDKIRSIFRDVAQAAESLCRRSKGTVKEDLDRSTYEKTRGLEQVESPIDAELYFDEIATLLDAHINRLPKQSQNYYRNRFESAYVATLKERYVLMKDILEAALQQGENDDRRAEEYGAILGILKNIEFSFSKRQSLSSMELRQALINLQTDINSLDGKLQSQGQNLAELSVLTETKYHAEFERLENTKNDMIKAIESFAEHYPNRENVDKILNEVQSLRVAKKRDVLGLIGDISSIAGLGLTIVALVA